MDSSCELCIFQKDCADETVFLYAMTPILRDILVLQLQATGAAFRLEKDLFAITRDQDQVLSGLRLALSEAERADIRVTKNRGAAIMAAPSLQQWERHTDTAWFDEAMRSDAFTSYFQPIVDTNEAKIFAHECLVRLFTDRPYNGAEIMEAALERGRMHLFDAYLRRLSIRKAAAEHLAGTKVFINFMPSSIYDPAYCMRSTLEEMSKGSLKPEDIVFEVVESETITDSRHLKKICDYYRRERFSFALDDVGSGSNSFQMICDLKPDYVKLDKSLISRIEDPMYYAAISKLSEFAAQFSVKVIAEGIETAETMTKLQAIGVHLMQGYYFAKPAAHMVNSSVDDLIRLNSKLTSSSLAARSKHNLVTL